MTQKLRFPRQVWTHCANPFSIPDAASARNILYFEGAYVFDVVDDFGLVFDHVKINSVRAIIQQVCRYLESAAKQSSGVRLATPVWFPTGSRVEDGIAFLRLHHDAQMNSRVRYKVPVLKLNRNRS